MDWKEQLQRARKENLPLFRKRVALYNRKQGIRVGDWIKHKNGSMDRVTYIWRDEHNKPLQYQTGGDKYGQFYMGDGYMSYSGGLDSGYQATQRFRKLSYEKLGQVWFFARDFATANNSIEYMMKFRVFEVV